MLWTDHSRAGRCMLAAVTFLAAFTLPRAFAEDMSAMPGMKSSSHVSKMTPADHAFMASMKTMMKNMAVKPTGDPDRDFVDMMMPHHAGAIDMAKVELQYGKDPMLLKLAADIVKAQESEIADMKAWKAQHP